MKVKTERGIENLNVKRCSCCGELVAPIQLFYRGKILMCDKCYMRHEDN